MYFIQYLYEIVEGYSVSEKNGTIILENINSDLDIVREEIKAKTDHSVVRIEEISPLK